MFSGLPRQSGSRRDGGAEHGVDDLARRIVGIEHDHVGAVDHDVGHGQLAQVEHAAEHVAVELLHVAVAMQQIDGAAQLLARRQDRLIFADRHADAAQDQRTSHSTAIRSGTERRDRAGIGCATPSASGRAR